MKIITYFTFTLLSIFIQFSLMDYIQERMQLDKPIDLNATSQKKQLSDVLKDMSHKPHALYYRTQRRKLVENNISTDIMINNSSLPEMPLITTDISTTILDVLYDEDSSIIGTRYTTEPLLTELDNVTDISLFEKQNETLIKLNVTPRNLNTDCYCNLLYKVCDINCCCDTDCSNNEIKMFLNCPANKNINNNQQNKEVCYSRIPYIGTESYIVNNLFCVVKTNLPERRNINLKQYDKEIISQFLKWESNCKTKDIHKFTNKMYKYGDPIWLLQNGSTSYVDLPFSMINNYCSGRKPIQFLNEVTIKCNVKLRDVEMIQIMKKSEEATIISATQLSLNSSALNCSTLYCVNWTLIFCDDDSCMHYNNSLHEPSCTETLCTNIALRMDFIFYYYDSKIINATIKFYVQNTSTIVPFMSQEINVKFLIANDSIDHIIQFSGGPGYRNGLPVIVSFAEENYTDNFYKSTKSKRHLSIPENINGICVSSKIMTNFIQFGINKRITCKCFHKYIPHNYTGTCQSIQNDLNKLLRLNDKVAVSPYGNPQDIRDDEWIPIKMETSDKGLVYEEFHDQSSELTCYNLITRVSLTLGFANINNDKDNGDSKIFTANFDVTRRNVSFNVEELSTLITIDINFIDFIKPSVFEYAAGGPQLNIYLPKDFFFPFPSNESYTFQCNMYSLIIYFSIAVLFCK